MKNLKQEKLYQRVYDEIREYIVTKDLAAGDKLPSEAELCETLGVSRNVIREALKALQLMGFVTPVPAVGYIIQDFTFDKIYQNIIYHVMPATNKIEADMVSTRAALEIAYFDQAYRSLTQADLLKLKAAAEKINAVIESQSYDLEKYIAAEREFHQIIYSHIDNEMFHSIILVTWEISTRMRLQNAAEDPGILKLFFDLPDYNPQTEQHMVLYRAFAQRNRSLAYQLTKKHFKQFFSIDENEQNLPEGI